MEDLIIKNAKIVDGTGQSSFLGEVLISEGKIKAVERNLGNQAEREIDAKGAVLAPGFVDLHSHSDLMVLKGKVGGKLKQGVTTEIVGNCGFSASPIPKERAKFASQVFSTVLGEASPGNWPEVKDYLQALKKSPLLINVGTLTGHSSLRLGVMGLVSREWNEKEKKEMKKALKLAFEQGSWGLSTGLIYAPGCYASFQELSELCRIAAHYNVPYVSHIRSEANLIIQAVKEALKLGRETGVHIHFSHHQIDGKENWGKANETLNLIQEAREDGFRVTLDQYPYQAGSTMLWALLPQWVQNKEKKEVLENLRKPDIKKRIKEDLNGKEDLLINVTGWENIMVNSLPKTKEFEQKTLKEAAEEKGINCSEFFIELVLENEGSGTVVLFDQSEEDWRRIFSDPLCSIATDSILVGEKPHPRSFGSYPKVLGEIVREKGIATLENAVSKMTLLPAETFGIPEIGAIKPGYRADLVIFNEDLIGYEGTYKEPVKDPEGIEYVLIEGKIVCRGGKVTGNYAGKALQKKS